ncbi:MAG TPA: hypothetical protein VFH14_06750 [Gemmatimonadaceae bacterium]|nr:hypothetical protein [Gemmatimonadaceae bacterium]
MNTKRILLGGLLAGALIIIGELVRQAIFTDATPAGGGSMPAGVFILRGASLGIFCVLLYSAVRPRLGAGVKTALTVGILVFLIGTLFPPFGLTMQAFAPARLLLETIMWNAIQVPLATVAGAWVYREGASEHDAAQLVLGEPLRPLR